MSERNRRSLTKRLNELYTEQLKSLNTSPTEIESEKFGDEIPDLKPNASYQSAKPSTIPSDKHTFISSLIGPLKIIGPVGLALISFVYYISNLDFRISALESTTSKTSEHVDGIKNNTHSFNGDLQLINKDIQYLNNDMKKNTDDIEKNRSAIQGLSRQVDINEAGIESLKKPQ